MHCVAYGHDVVMACRCSVRSLFVQCVAYGHDVVMACRCSVRSLFVQCVAFAHCQNLTRTRLLKSVRFLFVKL